MLDDETGLPVAGASVYLNNTSLGTVTNETGNFRIVNMIPGELVVSSVGYERLVYKLSSEQLNGKAYVFKLAAKQAMLRDVLMLSDAARKKYLQLFKENFLGITEEADRSTITNLAAINFAMGEKKQVMLAFADTPLIIINRKLGYIITFDLVEFYINEASRETAFYGFTRYEEMGDKKRWAANRRKVYYGSSLHFLRALIQNELEKEKFSMAILRTDTLKADTSKYGRTAKPRLVKIAVPTTAAQVVKTDSLSKIYVASWPHQLMIQYNRDPAGKHYLSQKTMVVGAVSNGARSYLTLNSSEVKIDQFGLLDDPRKLQYGGYWFYEKAASMLPYNYIPDKN